MDFELQPIKREIEIKGFNSIYYFEFDKNFYHLPEKHDFWEMVYVDSGQITAITDGFAQTLTQGQVIFHKPMEVHSHISDNKVPNNMLVVSFTCNSPLMMFFDKKVFTLQKNTKTLLSLFISEAKNALNTIPDKYENKNSPDFSSAPLGSVQLLECYLTEFLLVLKRCDSGLSEAFNRNDSSRAIAQSSIIDLICEYMKNSVYSDISLQDICRRFLMGKSQLCSIFKSNLGKSPMEYFNTLKTDEAKRLLRDDSLSITAISDKLGYLSIHNFSRAFKTKTGFSPSEYRARLNK